MALGASAFGATQFVAIVGIGIPFHVIYKVGEAGKWLHAGGETLGSLTVEAADASLVRYVNKTVYLRFTGPIFFSGAAMQTGQQALTCFTAAGHAMLKGWFPLHPMTFPYFRLPIELHDRLGEILERGGPHALKEWTDFEYPPGISGPQPADDPTYKCFLISEGTL